MAYVKFYRGLEANLAQVSNLEEGAFYLTTDTWRLYNVIDEGTSGTPNLQLRPLGEKINMFHNIASISSAADHIGEFAYIEQGNIFCVSIADTPSGAKWVQVNKNTALSSLAFDAAATSNVATVELDARRADDPNNGITADFDVAGGSGITVTATAATSTTNPVVTIARNQIPVSVAATADTKPHAKVNVDGTDVEFIPGTGITLATDGTNKTVTINGSLGGVSNVVADPAASGSTGFIFGVTGADGSQADDTLDPAITLGTNDNQYKFSGGVVNLPVYTKEEIDNSLTGLNAMVYRGTIGATNGTTTSVPTTTAPTGNNPDTRPQIGDTYKVVDDVTVVTADNPQGATAHPGDLIIARGTEGSSGRIESNLVWDIVRGADDVDTQYTLHPITNGASLIINGDNNSLENPEGSLTINGGTMLTATSQATGNDNVITINHDTITQSADATSGSATQQEGNPQTYTAVTGVSINSTGHVTGLSKGTFTVVDTTLTEADDALETTVGISNQTVTVTNSVAITDTAGTQVGGSDSFTMTSSGGTINMTVSGSNINSDIVWGTF